MTTSAWGYRKGIGAIIIDFRKAFDSVCPAILFHKLEACGISGNLFQWLNSYLSNRHQFVELNGVKSPVLEVFIIIISLYFSKVLTSRLTILTCPQVAS